MSTIMYLLFSFTHILSTFFAQIGDIPDADMKPPDNVLFVCKLNPVTQVSVDFVEVYISLQLEDSCIFSCCCNLSIIKYFQ